MTARWGYPRERDEFAWPGVPYEGKGQPVPLRVILAELRVTLCPKR